MPSPWPVRALPQTLQTGAPRGAEVGGQIMSGGLTRTWLLASTLAAGVLTPLQAGAEPLKSRFSVELGAFFPEVETVAQVSSGALPGTRIDFESATGLEDAPTLPSIRGSARFGRWLWEGEYFSLRRNGSSVLAADIDFDGVLYPASVEVDSAFNTEIYRASVGYLFIKSPTFALGGTLGLHATSFDLSMSGEGQVGGSGPVQTERRQREFLAPLPTAGLFAAWEVSPRLTLGGRFDLFSLSYQDFSGGVTNAEATVSYSFTEHVDVGVSYRYLAYDLEVDRPQYDAAIDYTFSGPSAFVRFNF